MVRVIQITGEEIGSVTDIDLTPYVPGHIARLVTCTVRVNQPDQTVVWAGSIHEGDLWGGSDHAGNLWTSSLLPSTLPADQDVEGSEPDWDPVGSEPDWTPVGSLGAVIGPTVRDHWIYNSGFVDTTDANSAPAAQSATLTGPLTLRLGDDLGSADILQLNVLLLGEAAGVFY